MTASENLLEIRDYSFQFPSYPGLNSRPLFTSMNFTLKRGDFCIILGAPESGKTTLGRCLTNLYPGMTRADVSGSILLRGKPLYSRSACDWIETAGTVLQDPEEQIITTRCDDEAAMLLESMGRVPGEIMTSMAEAFSRFSLTGKEERDPLSLSGGEKKRLLLAALEMQNPDLWILDETMDELDREGQEFLLTYLETIAGEQGKGIILFASKYRDLFDSISARKVLLKDGTLQEEGDDPLLFTELLAAEGLVSSGGEPLSAGAVENESIYELKDIRFSYPGKGTFGLEIDSFSIRKGEIVVLAGPNGCGKSTLARILCGLLIPDSGTVQLKGEAAGKDELNRNGAYLFQNPDYQLFLPTVEEELALGLKHRGLKKGELKKRTDEAMDLFKLPSGEAPPALLSFGARKRLQGAIYYLLDKNLYILDEADSGLSFSDYNCIVRELKRKGAAMIVISHDPKVQRMAAHRVVEMKDGRILGENVL